MYEKISEIIAEVLNIDASEVDLTSDFKDDLDADSLNLFELVMAIESEYDVEVPSEDLEDIKTVGDMIEYLKSKGIED